MEAVTGREGGGELMTDQGPVPPGMSPVHEGAMTVPCHAAEQDAGEMSWSELAECLVPQAAGWPGGDPPDLSGEEPPPWLDDDYSDPEDPSAEDWDYLALAVQAEAGGAGTGNGGGGCSVMTSGPGTPTTAVSRPCLA